MRGSSFASAAETGWSWERKPRSPNPARAPTPAVVLMKFRRFISLVAALARAWRGCSRRRKRQRHALASAAMEFGEWHGRKLFLLHRLARLFPGAEARLEVYDVREGDFVHDSASLGAADAARAMHQIGLILVQFGDL